MISELCAVFYLFKKVWMVIKAHIIKLLFVMITFLAACHTQTTKNMNNINPLLCNPDTGLCELPEIQKQETENQNIGSTSKPVRVVYFTDPICSSCWGIEPQLRRLKLEFGEYLDIEYRMGGLLPDWSYNSGGISKPFDVAQHWDEVSLHYEMPIDGDVWLEDPLASSFPPSIAFKAAQMQDGSKAIQFLRVIREMVFLHKINITKIEHLESAAKEVGLDAGKFLIDYNGRANDIFLSDLSIARDAGVRGFPTIFFYSASGESVKVYGSKPYEEYRNAIKQVFPDAKEILYQKDWKSLFGHYKTLTVKEYSVLSGLSKNQSESILNDLFLKGILVKHHTKNGDIWTLKE